MSDKEKREQRFLQVYTTELNANEPMKKLRKGNYDVENKQLRLCL